MSAEEADKFSHDAFIWFNAAISSSTPWSESTKGSGFVGLDRLNEYSRFDFGNLRLFKFWGFRKKTLNRTSEFPPFAMNVVVSKRLGQAIVNVTVGNGHLVPFVCCAWGLFVHWISSYSSLQMIDDRALLYRQVITQSDCPSDWTVLSNGKQKPVFFQSLLNDALMLGEFVGMCHFSKQLVRNTIPVGMVFADQLAKVIPKDLLSNVEKCRQSYESSTDLPFHEATLQCDEKSSREFLAFVSKRLTFISMSPIQSDLKELRKNECARRELRGLRHKNKRKRTDLFCSQTETLMLRGEMNNFDPDGRLIDEHIADAEYASVTHSIIKKTHIPRTKLARRASRATKTIFDVHWEQEFEKDKQKLKALQDSFQEIADSHLHYSIVTLNQEDFMKPQSQVDVGAFFAECDRRMILLEQEAEEKEHLKAEVERLSLINWEFEERIHALEERLRESESTLREQKSLNEHLSEQLTGKVQSSSKELSVMAMLVADPSKNISASEALRTAEILSGGRLIVLPSARKSAHEVPSGFHAGNKLFQLLMRLTQLWLPQFLASGDAVAKKVFTNNTYTAKETRVLQNTKRLVQARTFKYRGREIPMMKHLCIGVKRDTSKTIRVYFEADQEEGKVIVGWCGEHLPIACRLART